MRKPIVTRDALRAGGRITGGLAASGLAVLVLLSNAGVSAMAASAMHPRSGQKILFTAFRRTAAVGSAHFDVTAGVSIPGNGKTTVRMSGIETVGKVAHPAAEMTLTGLLGNGAMMKELVTPQALFVNFGKSSGVTLPNGATWERINLSDLSSVLGVKDPAALFSGNNGDPSQLLSLFSSAAVGGVKDAGRGSVGGVEVTRYEATVNLDSLSTHESTAYQQLLQHFRKYLTSTDLTIHVGIDKAGLARQVSYVADERLPLNGTETNVSVSLNMELGEFGVPVHVTPPPASEVYTVPASALKRVGQAAGL